MSKRTFTKKQLRAILWDEEGEVVLNKITGTGRWDTHYRFIFKPEGEDKLYETEYSKGSTEQQDSQGPWEYEDEIECDEVEAYEKTVTDYRPVGTAEPGPCGNKNGEWGCTEKAGHDGPHRHPWRPQTW